MDVLKTIVAKPGWITSHVVAMLLVAFASCGAVFSQGQRTGGPTPSAPGAEVYFIDLKDGMTVPADGTMPAAGVYTSVPGTDEAAFNWALERAVP